MEKKTGINALIIALLFTFSACQSPSSKSEEKDISILYTTDVHCGLKDHLGYSSLVAYKEKLAKTNYVALVDSGDYLQGDFVGAVSSGKYIIDVMNEANYDVVTLGNHEFDYGIDVLKMRMEEFKGDVVSCNLSYVGNNENKLSDVKPYVIKQYGEKKVGFVGVTTPLTLVTSNPKTFYEEDKIVYDFGSSSPEHFYSVVQSAIDHCKTDGADYVILLSHLGSSDTYSPYSSVDVIENTSGATAFLDGHAHLDLDWTTVKDKKNQDIPLVDAGYKLNKFAVLTIKTDGSLQKEYLSTCDEKSTKMDSFIDSLLKDAESLGNQVVANIDIDLPITDEEGVRLTRTRETAIGNMISDAYRSITEAEIGFINGGGIRESLKKGDVTYKQIKDVHPFGNVLKKKKTKGSHILDYLEMGASKVKKEYKADGKAIGEFGGFVHVSGLKYKVDTSIESHVVLDSKGEFVKVDGDRRVKDIYVLEEGKYVPIDPLKDYVVASNHFLLDDGGDGANMFKQDESIPTEQKFDYEVLIDYIVHTCKGKLKEKYGQLEGRIVIE